MTYNSKNYWNYYAKNFFQEDFFRDLKNCILNLNFFHTLKNSVEQKWLHNYFSGECNRQTSLWNEESTENTSIMP